MKEITRTIELPDGRILPLTADRYDINELKQELRDSEGKYRRDPSLRNYLLLHFVQAQLDDAKGKTVEAAENLLYVLNPDNLAAQFPDTPGGHKQLLQYQDTASFLVELLLYLGRIDEALRWADALYHNAEDNFYGSTIVPYAMNLYGCCLEAAGRKSDAGYMYECSLSEAEAVISDMQSLRDSVKINLDGLWK